MRPHLVWSIDRNYSNEDLTITFTLLNQGIGPALIRDRYFELDGKRFHADDVEVLAKTILEGQFSYHVTKNGLPGIGSSMPPSGKVVIAKVAIDIKVPEDRKKVEAILNRTSFKVRYESLYQETLKLE